MSKFLDDSAFQNIIEKCADAKKECNNKLASFEIEVNSDFEKDSKRVCDKTSQLLLEGKKSNDNFFNTLFMSIETLINEKSKERSLIYKDKVKEFKIY